MNPLFLLIREASSRLETIGAGNPRLEAEYLMAHAVGVERIALWLRDDPPADEQIARFDALLARRMAREPLQYVLGSTHFAGLDLEVGPGVFIPRSETEVLVERVAERLESSGPIEVADVGTGSGAIILALLARLPEARGIGVDQSPEALEFARLNGVRTGLASRVEWRLGDLLGATGDRVFHAVVSNPPYIAESESADLAPEIRDHEPRGALLAGADGLDTIRRLIPQAAARLRPGGLLAMEMGVTQGEAVLRLLRSAEWREPAILPDMTRRPRIALALRA